jgi:hypothetical protein
VFGCVYVFAGMFGCIYVLAGICTIDFDMPVSGKMHSWLRQLVREREGIGAPRHQHSSTVPSKRFSGLLTKAWADSTWRNYEGSIKRFGHFCAGLGMELSAELSVDEQVLCLFIQSLAGLRSGSHIRNEIAAIRAFHIINNLHWHDSVRLRYMLKAADNVAPISSHRHPRLAVDVRMLVHLHGSLDLSCPFDACCFAVATCAFWGQARLGELIPSALSNRRFDRLPSLDDLKPASTSAGSRVLLIPWTKTTGQKGAKIFLCRQKGETDAIAALENHVKVNVPTPGMLFSFRVRDDLRKMTKSRFLLRINSIGLSAGFHRVTGHSFRIGGTTELLLRGVEPKVVQVMGRWSSDAFLRYWRAVELLAPLHAELLS